MSDEYYLQDARQYIGNAVVWWAENGAGYTADITRAHVFTKKHAMEQHAERDTDVPWLKSYVDEKIMHVVDVQHIDRERNREEIARLIE